MSAVTGPSQPAALRAALPWPERVYQAALTAALAGLGFFVTWSSAGAALAVGALVLLALAAPLRIWRQRPWREPVLAVGLALLAYMLLRTAFGEGLAAIRAVNKYQELLLAPLLWALMRIARRPQVFVRGLLAGALLLAVAYWIGAPRETWFGNWLVLHRISASFGLAVCAFLLFEHARLRRVPPLAGYALALFLAVTVLVAISARTGYLVLLVLAACAGFRAAPPRARLATGLAVLLVALGAAAVSPTVRGRVMETLHDSEADSRGVAVKDSSTQQRLEIWENGVTVATENWVLGTGWKHYPAAVQEVSLRRHPDPRAVPGALSANPHSEYLLQLGAGGLPALLLFVAWLAAPVVRAMRHGGAAGNWNGTLACVALAFALGCVFNSLLLDFIEGHLYAALLAWLLARPIEE